MALSNWNVYKSHSNLIVQIDVTSPMVGTGSLQLQKTDSGGQRNFTSLVSTSYTPGILHGKMRQIVRCNSGNRTRFGFSFCHSHVNITGNSGRNWYEANPYIDSAGSVRSWRIVRVVGGEGIGTVTSLFSGGPGWSTSTNFTMEVEWHVDVSGLGGTQIILRSGTLTDFSDLTQITTLVDPTPNALITSLGEGPHVTQWDTFGDNYNVRFDNTSVTSFV